MYEAPRARVVRAALLRAQAAALRDAEANQPDWDAIGRCAGCIEISVSSWPATALTSTRHWCGAGGRSYTPGSPISGGCMVKPLDPSKPAIDTVAETVGRALGSIAGTFDSLQAQHPHPVDEAREALAAGGERAAAMASAAGLTTAAAANKARRARKKAAAAAITAAVGVKKVRRVARRRRTVAKATSGTSRKTARAVRRTKRKVRRSVRKVRRSVRRVKRSVRRVKRTVKRARRKTAKLRTAGRRRR